MIPSPPIEPMLAKLVDALPDGRRLSLRTQVGRLPRDRLSDGGRRLHPEPRSAAARSLLPRAARRADRISCRRSACLTARSSSPTPHGLDFDALQLRLHPAASRVAKLARTSPASFVAFDLLAARDELRSIAPERPPRSARAPARAVSSPPVYLTPMTRDRAVAAEWLERFEGAGLDGVIAKPADGPYEPGKRAMFKIKHARTADCVVAGFRWHKSGRDALGSLLLGLYDDDGDAAPRRRDVVLHDGSAAERSSTSSSRCGRTRSPPSVARLGARERARASECPADTAAGAPAKTCRGSRFASSASAR